MIRPTPLRRYLSVMAQRGFGEAQVLSGLDLDLARLEDPQYLVETQTCLALVQRMLDLAGEDSGLGLDVGLAREVSDFRILGYAAMACRTVRHSMQEFWYRYGEPLGMLSKVDLPDSAAAEVAGELLVPDPTPQVARFFIEEALCVLLKVGAQVAGSPPAFVRLRFPYAAPPYLDRYRALFACPMHFRSACAEITFKRKWLDMPLVTTDPELLALYEKSLVQIKREIEQSQTLVARIGQLFNAMGGRLPALEMTARALGLSARTLRRRLQEEDTSYREVGYALRSELACRSLVDGPISTKQLSERMGFEDVNAFRRAFKQWTGHTVGSYRALASRGEGR